MCLAPTGASMSGKHKMLRISYVNACNNGITRSIVQAMPRYLPYKIPGPVRCRGLCVSHPATVELRGKILDPAAHGMGAPQ